MTREDREKAIEILRADDISGYSVEDILSARDMAIKALEQESTTRADDCVSRQFMYELGATCIAMRSENGKLIALGAIEDLPSVTPQEPRKGHWIDDEFGSKCSCCDIHTHLDKFDRPMKFKYCSMCGTKMESEDNNEIM